MLLIKICSVSCSGLFLLCLAYRGMVNKAFPKHKLMIIFVKHLGFPFRFQCMRQLEMLVVFVFPKKGPGSISIRLSLFFSHWNQMPSATCSRCLTNDLPIHFSPCIYVENWSSRINLQFESILHRWPSRKMFFGALLTSRNPLLTYSPHRPADLWHLLIEQATKPVIEPSFMHNYLYSTPDLLQI